MNKKQAVIIFSLMVLIVCAGILATKLNTPFSDAQTDVGKSAVSITNDQSTTKQDLFAQSRQEKTNAYNNAIQALKNMADDKNVAKESQQSAATQAQVYITNSVTETKIESAIKGQGFQDAICYIEDTKVRIMVKSKSKLTTEQERSIKDAVTSISHIRDVAIQVIE